MEQAKQLLNKAVTTAKAVYEQEAIRGKTGQRYMTLEDFQRCPPQSKRMVVIGCTGAGKSTLLNMMGGWKFVQDTKEYEWAWQNQEGQPPLFEATHSVNAVTQQTSFANMRWFGDEEKPFVAIDTPGHDDTAGRNIEDAAARDVLREQAADLHNKLKALGHVHTILVVHNQVTSNRLNPATYAILQMIDEKFKDQPVWPNVVVAYSQCNEHETSWRSNLSQKKKDLQAEIKNQIDGCDVDVPVIALGGGVLEGNESPNPGDFETLWEILNTAEPIDTSELQPFDGEVWQKFETMIEARDAALARADAALVYMSVVIKIGIVLAFFFWRSMLIPTWLSVMFLNLPNSQMDEFAIIVAVLYVIGPTKVRYCLSFFYESWVDPYVGPTINPMLAKYWPKLKPKAE